MPNIDTKSVPAVAEVVRKTARELFPNGSSAWIDVLFADVEALFTGRHPDYRANDLRYHDLEHTLQVALCFTRLVAGRQRAGFTPILTARQFELGVAAALLHDSGYLKLRSDAQGTGAKYTYVHVLRSCALAGSYLPKLDATSAEIDGVLGAICCTGHSLHVDQMRFNHTAEKTIACLVATADYLGQMAAAEYPDELGCLFEEFQESDDYVRTPLAERTFKSSDDLMEKTPNFWRKIVLPKLETTYHGVYRFLADPYPHGPNPYIEAVERNIAQVQRRIEVRRGKVERLVS
jgi:hypothetical protein